jgi:hypothetical protein
MPITESRLKSGTLTIDALPFATQATNVRLVPKTDEVGDPIEVLSGDEQSAEDETTWSLVITAIQDFDDVDGFVRFAMDNAGTSVPFVWRPNASSTNQFTGTVKVRPVEIGGDVNKRLTTSAEWPLDGAPTPGTSA